MWGWRVGRPCGSHLQPLDLHPVPLQPEQQQARLCHRHVPSPEALRQAHLRHVALSRDLERREPGERSEENLHDINVGTPPAELLPQQEEARAALHEQRVVLDLALLVHQSLLTELSLQRHHRHRDSTRAPDATNVLHRAEYEVNGERRARELAERHPLAQPLTLVGLLERSEAAPHDALAAQRVHLRDAVEHSKLFRITTNNSEDESIQRNLIIMMVVAVVVAIVIDH